MGPHCDVVIRGTLDARGGSGAAAGSNTIEAKAITIASTARLRATPCTTPPPGSCNTPILREGDPVVQPGAVVDPPFPPEPIHDPTLPVCCGNTVVEPWEECDDGNEQWCDQCTPACRTPVPCAADDDPCTGDTCVPSIGCEPLTGPTCADDGNPCTDDVCEQGRCTHPSPCDGARDDACGGGTCDPVLGCVFHPLPDGMQCALVCTGSGSTSGSCRDGRCINAMRRWRRVHDRRLLDTKPLWAFRRPLPPRLYGLRRRHSVQRRSRLHDRALHGPHMCRRAGDVRCDQRL